MFLFLGLLAEPLGGGIRKDSPTTLSYHLVTVGLAFYAILGLGVLIEGLKVRWLKPVIETGQNPILGYLVITNLVISLAGLTKVESVYGLKDLNPWLITGVGFLKTVAVMLFVAWATRRKWFLRA